MMITLQLQHEVNVIVKYGACIADGPSSSSQVVFQTLRKQSGLGPTVKAELGTR